MPKTNYTKRENELRHLLENWATEIGSATQFVQRESKMSASCFCQTVILGSLEEGNKSLNDFAQISQELGVAITPSGLNQRFNESAVEMLKQLLAKSIDLNVKASQEAPFLSQFSDVQLVDSSYMGLPKGLKEAFPGIGRSTTAGLKLFLNYSYRFGQIKALEVASGRTMDQSHRIHIEHAREGSLTMFDLGFFNQTIFQQFEDKNAYFIVRYQNQTALYEENLDRFDLVTYLKKSKSNEVNLSVRIGSKVKTPIRLIALRLPKEVAAERRRQAKKKAKADGRRPTPPAERLALLDWAIFVTNVPPALLSGDQVTLIYRLRWQIELIFKVWKSSARLKEIGEFRGERVLCQLYARLTALVLFHLLIAPTVALHKELSLAKAFSLLKRHALRLIDAFAGNRTQLLSILKKIDRDLLRFGRMDKRIKKPCTYQLLLEAGL
jgi:hypothetical protein